MLEDSDKLTSLTPVITTISTALPTVVTSMEAMNLITTISNANANALAPASPPTAVLTVCSTSKLPANTFEAINTEVNKLETIDCIDTLENNETEKISQKLGVLPTDSNPLEDIEKFIQAGVNLLKSDYRIESGESVEGVTMNPTDVQRGVDPSDININNNSSNGNNDNNDNDNGDNDTQVDNNVFEDCRQPAVATKIPLNMSNESVLHDDAQMVTDTDAEIVDEAYTAMTNAISQMMDDVKLADKLANVHKALTEKAVMAKDQPVSNNADCKQDSQELVDPASVERLPSPPKAGTIIDEDVVMKDIIPLTAENSFATPSSMMESNPCTDITDTNAVVSPPDTGVRRSHRIKKINNISKAVVGRGLVRDRERFSLKDIETKAQYTFDDHLTDLAEVDAKNAKFLKEMEERLSNFQVIKENEYKCERIVSREARKMICDCFLTVDEEERGEFGCGEDCLNRLLMIECGPDCNVKDRCTNKRFQRYLYSPCRVFRTEKKGFGIMADSEIHPSEFIMEYIGEVINSDEFERRRNNYSRDKNRHYYFMALRSDMIIDATRKGNISRFINHSCDPNAETQKWTVNGELRIGFFSRKTIMPGEEITFDYQYQRYGREAQRCFCESANCRGWIGQEPASDEGEQHNDDSNDDDDDDDDEDDDDVVNAENLLGAADDFESDSDDNLNDPAAVQRKLEMAAAAELDLDMNLSVKSRYNQRTTKLEKGKDKKSLMTNTPSLDDSLEDSTAKLQRLLTKVAEKVAAKRQENKQKQQEQKRRRGRRKLSDHMAAGMSGHRLLEDPDIENEVEFLKACGVKNQSDTLRLSRLMVRAKILTTRLNLLEILERGELPCRRLFLDYHGLRLLHGWMSEDQTNLEVRQALLRTLKTLPIVNKTILNDSKVIKVVRQWAEKKDEVATADTNLQQIEGSGKPEQPLAKNNEHKASEGEVKVDTPAEKEEATSTEPLDPSKVQQLAAELLASWEVLPEIFRIPKKERIEQMKEHEREADRQYAENAKDESVDFNLVDQYKRDRFGRNFSTITTLTSDNRVFQRKHPEQYFSHPNGFKYLSRGRNLSKKEFRELFAARVAQEEALKRIAEERKEHEIKCRFFGLDPRKVTPRNMPFCVNPSTAQWYTREMKPIATPPSYVHVPVARRPQSTDPNDYELPPCVAELPSDWTYAITNMGTIYYYHLEQRISQWEPPTAEQIKFCRGDESSESEIDGVDQSKEDEILMNLEKEDLNAYIEKLIEKKRKKRSMNLVDKRSISPRREEDRIYNQIEVRKYKENKEKIRRRKEELRRKRLETVSLPNNTYESTGNNVTIVIREAEETKAIVNDAEGKELDKETAMDDDGTPSISETISPSVISVKENDKDLINALPIQDYLLSSEDDEENQEKEEEGAIATVAKEEEKPKTEMEKNGEKMEQHEKDDDDDEEDDVKMGSSKLLEKIMAGNRIVDELDALRRKKALKRPLTLTHGRMDQQPSSSSHHQGGVSSSSKSRKGSSSSKSRQGGAVSSSSSKPRQVDFSSSKSVHAESTSSKPRQGDFSSSKSVHAESTSSKPAEAESSSSQPPQGERTSSQPIQGESSSSKPSQNDVHENGSAAKLPLPSDEKHQHEQRKRKLEKKDKRKDRDDKECNYRKLREKFRCEIAGIIVHYLKPYLKETCKVARIQSIDDFNHLARKLTHFVMIKELKYCESVGQTLVVTESVKNKTREFIKKYMTKYGEVYVKPENDPEFKGIPCSLKDLGETSLVHVKTREDHGSER